MSWCDRLWVKGYGRLCHYTITIDGITPKGFLKFTINLDDKKISRRTKSIFGNMLNYISGDVEVQARLPI